MSKQTETLDRSAELIHRAAIYPECWPEALKYLESVLGADNVNLVIIGGDNPMVSSFQASSLTTDIVSDYQNRFPSGDVWIHNLSKLPIGGIYRSSFLYPNRKLVRTRFYEEFLRPIGMFHCAGGYFERLGGTLGMMSALLPEKTGGFSDDQIKRMAAVQKHLKSALHTSSAVSTLKTTLELQHQALDHQNVALALITPTGKAIFLNKPFEELIKKNMLVNVNNSQISFKDQRTHGWLQARLRDIHNVGQLVSARGEYKVIDLFGYELRLNLSAIDAAEFSSSEKTSTLALLSIRLPPSRATILAQLRSLGAPPTASLVAYHLLAGQSLREASQQLCISYETARSHLKRLFRNFHVNNQRQLTAFLKILLQ